MKYHTGITDAEVELIKGVLPATILRGGRDRWLSAGRKDGNYQIWYGEIITGNYIAEHKNLVMAVCRMYEYIHHYKDMDEVVFMNLGMRTGECPNCKVELARDGTDGAWFYCPECKTCFRHTGWIGHLWFRLWHWIYLGCSNEDKS